MAIPNRTEAKQMRSNPHRIHEFKIANLLTDPFAISLLSLALISWIIAFVGSVTAASNSSKYPPFAWWGIAYQFLLLVIIFFLYCYELIDYYRSFLAGALAVAFIYTTNSTGDLIYLDGSRMGAASAGLILLSMINAIWLFYFGADNASPSNRWIDSYSLKGIRHSVFESSIALSSRPTMAGRNVSKYSATPHDAPYSEQLPHSTSFYPDTHSQHYVSSTALNGFENAEPPAAPALQNNLPNTQNSNTFFTDTTNGNTETTMGDTLGLYSDAGDELGSFPYVAKALYTYSADSNDAYEVSFEQGETLRVGDIEGRWWKAKRANGQTGIIPSNYVELISESSF
ncbi:LANO_0F11980g1_1 [Lachancea nothofagi CBS 11611]|uniref:High osmolarity signaling protein SHO1 n=1 Tax=Lachancea nothofagi CBS 11611 TaxID=1266666 RepID=A0A1G4KBD1_9SACH|nr:LANO_0F11980g1_1 [Lachancea nothofagi CBS 11611]